MDRSNRAPWPDIFLWQKRSSRVKVIFSKRIVALPLPGTPDKVALLDGPAVLAGLTDKEVPVALGTGSTAIPPVPVYEHQYSASGDWQLGDYLLRSSGDSITLKPLHEVTDERYPVYFPTSSAALTPVIAL